MLIPAACSTRADETRLIDLDLVVKVVQQPDLQPAGELAAAPCSIKHAAGQIESATGKRIYEQARYQGWRIFSTVPFSEEPRALRFLSGYALRPGAKAFYGFGFW